MMYSTLCLSFRLLLEETPDSCVIPRNELSEMKGAKLKNRELFDVLLSPKKSKKKLFETHSSSLVTASNNEACCKKKMPSVH